jgi:single-stranded-DNA-specific exonuclease
VRQATTFDLGFMLGPRLNAAGRLDDMRIGIQCLLTDHADEALELATTLDTLNRERKTIEGDMKQQALDALDLVDPQELQQRNSVVLFDPEFHEGVIGIVASRIKDQFYRPTIVFATAHEHDQAGNPIEGRIKGSGRSIVGVHMRDMIDWISKQVPDLIIKFGGHAMAAGLTIDEDRLSEFEAYFEQAVRHFADDGALVQQIDTDGSLPLSYYHLNTPLLLNQQVWGSGFPPPLFVDTFQVVQQKILKEQHLKLTLHREGQPRQQTVEAVWFNVPNEYLYTMSETIRCVYQLDVNQFRGQSTLQLMIKHVL